MVYQFLGNKRIPLPACAYMAIRKTFPVTEKEAFTGYVDESDQKINITFCMRPNYLVKGPQCQYEVIF